MTDESDVLGYLGAHGVMIIPPEEGDEGWLVTVGGWDEKVEAYVAGSDGPLLETRDEAIQTAIRAMEWIQSAGPNVDIPRVWREMQDRVAAQENPDSMPRRGYRWPFP
jgi:hypothetical protein